MDFGKKAPGSISQIFPDLLDRKQVVWWDKNWWKYRSAEAAQEDFIYETAQERMRPTEMSDDPIFETNSVIETDVAMRDTSRSMIQETILKTAEHFGLTVEELTIAAQAARAAKEATRHAGVWSILRVLTPRQVAAVVENSTVGKLYHRFHEMMQTIALPTAGFTDKAQSAAAARLSETYRELKKHQIKLGIDPTTKDSRVGEAERLRALFEYTPRPKRTAPARSRRSRQTEAPPPP